MCYIRQGDIWAESSMFGLRKKFYACMEYDIYDITDWAYCQVGIISFVVSSIGCYWQAGRNTLADNRVPKFELFEFGFWFALRYSDWPIHPYMASAFLDLGRIKY